MPGFSLFRSDRTYESEKTKGGGVCVFVNNRYCHANNVNIIHQVSCPEFELLTVKIKIVPFYLPREFPSVYVNICYIPPDADFTAASDRIIDLVNDQQSKSPDSCVLINGDFNTCTLDLPHFDQYVNVPTRKDNILDLFYSNVNNAYTCKGLAPLGNSDHNMILLRPKYLPVLKRMKAERKNVRVIDTECAEQLQDCFDSTDWDVFTSACDGADELCDTVTDYIRFCETEVTTEKEVKIFNNNKPWITKDIKALLQEKQKAFLDRDTNLQKDIDKKVKKQINSEKFKYKQKLENHFKSGNSKETWQCLKTMTGYSDKNVVTVDNVDKNYVNDMNSFFARFEDVDNRVCEEPACVTECVDEDVVLNEWEVKRSFNRLKERKACGPDHLKPKLLKLCASQLTPIFTFIMNLSLKTHVIPSIWKCSEILPIPKRLITQLNDFRPVALTPVPMKCMEKLILLRIKASFTQVQDPFQFAYRSGRSVEDAILLLLNNMYEHLDKPKSIVRTLFLDFSSAFNTIKPVILIERLRELNINSNIISWVFQFLTNRTQYVKFQNFVSDPISTFTGSPQGCVLSPVLFTIYTNVCQIDNNIVKLIKFADDSCIEGLITSEDDTDLYFRDIDYFTTWCTENKLLLNTDKTKEVIFDFRTKPSEIRPVVINGTVIEQVDSYKYLGVVIDNKLRWEEQATAVSKKINKRMFFLRKLSSFHVDNTLLDLFYETTIQSIICFCVIAWGGNVSILCKKKINKVIKRASRITHSELSHFDELLCHLSLKKIMAIENSDHPLASKIKRSVRSNRPLFIKTKTERFSRSFLPFSIKLIKHQR